jgi:hypothetical protein
MNKTYMVRLTDDERQELWQLTSRGKAAAYKIKHAHILLQVDANKAHRSDEEGWRRRWGAKNNPSPRASASLRAPKRTRSQGEP